ncbi:DeoR/GlpR transcriptional regulator [Ruficoccus amylovorans]|uniref:DeoR/GlpR transcriptional regulator n=1 Tax=Ruficoccus amylovorans TaxID=1804625 RepID=A0A842HI36_9BACT|nr:DeoR/GlpR family DNA-binding transcription regulator [Ruficoccus amylovorans]MBC2596445.1 DeoR/GlpR transcriptional regulator [Ruficoccus amylovorans]
MTNKQRLDLIEKYIREHKYADLHTLAEKFDISLSTVRRALNDLEAANIICRHHGGASLVEEDANSSGYDFITQDNRHTEQKHAIARKMAQLIEPGATVMLDGGTTTYTVARALVEKRLVVITNSLPIAALFGEVGSSETIVTGGTVYSRLGILYGPACEQAINRVHVDIAVCGCAGLTPEGIWNNNSFLASFQQHMLNVCDKLYFVMDSSKLGKRALSLVTELSDKYTLITDREPPPEIAGPAAEAGTEIIVAPPAKIEP